MTRLMHSCDVLIAPEERFSLSTAEALAAGVPAVMTVAHREWEYELYAPQENAVELGERLIEVLSEAELRERLRRRGRSIAERWRGANVAPRLEDALER